MTPSGPARPRYEGRAVITALREPTPTGVELGRIDVAVTGSLQTAAEEFREQVEALGGDRGVIDQFFTAFEIVTLRAPRSRFGCDEVSSSRPCGGIEEREDRMPVLHLVGRAFDTRSAP
ncbi:MAG: hypothetical protein OHK0013_05660 [Sandaracinaceae bacterium]